MSGLPYADAFLVELGSRLRGPRRLRRDLTDEIRTGIEDATADLVAQGWSLESAERQAVADFGRPAELAAAFGSELAVAESRRTAGLAALTFPVLLGCWTLAWRQVPRPLAADPAVPALSRLTDQVALGTTVLILAGLALLGFPAARSLARPVAAAVASVVLLGLVVVLGLSAAMTLLNDGATVAFAATAFGAATLGLTAVAVVALSVAAARCVRTALRPA